MYIVQAKRLKFDEDDTSENDDKASPVAGERKQLKKVNSHLISNVFLILNATFGACVNSNIKFNDTLVIKQPMPPILTGDEEDQIKAKAGRATGRRRTKVCCCMMRTLQ